jgi:hypothetical protein
MSDSHQNSFEKCKKFSFSMTKSSLFKNNQANLKFNAVSLQKFWNFFLRALTFTKKSYRVSKKYSFKLTWNDIQNTPSTSPCGIQMARSSGFQSLESSAQSPRHEKWPHGLRILK